jgi:hypothetical protein
MGWVGGTCRATRAAPLTCPRWHHSRALALNPMDLEQIERRLRERLDALGPAPHAELLHVLVLPDFERADAIGSYYANPMS